MKNKSVGITGTEVSNAKQLRTALKTRATEMDNGAGVTTRPNIERMGFEKNRRFVRGFNNQRITETVGGKLCRFRSKLEYAVAKYLELLKQSGHIRDWYFETKTFEFADESYLPDFWIWQNDGTQYVLEAKGHPDQRTRRKLKLMDKYYTDVPIEMVFQTKRDMNKLGTAKKYCRRVMILSELTHAE